MLHKMKNLYRSIGKKAIWSIAAACSIIVARHPIMARADDLDWLKGEGSGALDELTDTVKSTGADIYQLLMAIGVVGLAIAIILAGISYATNHNAQKKSENKDRMLAIAIGGIIVFGALFILGLIQTIGSSLG